MARCPAHGNRFQQTPSGVVNQIGATPQPDCHRTTGSEVFGKLLEYRHVELGVGVHALETVVLLLQLLEAFGFCGVHAAMQLLPPALSGSRHLQSPADVGEALALVEERPSGAQVLEALLGSMALAFRGVSPSQLWPVGRLS